MDEVYTVNTFNIANCVFSYSSKCYNIFPFNLKWYTVKQTLVLHTVVSFESPKKLRYFLGHSNDTTVCQNNKFVFTV